MPGISTPEYITYWALRDILLLTFWPLERVSSAVSSFSFITPSFIILTQISMWCDSDPKMILERALGKQFPSPYVDTGRTFPGPSFGKKFMATQSTVSLPDISWCTPLLKGGISSFLTILFSSSYVVAEFHFWRIQFQSVWHTTSSWNSILSSVLTTGIKSSAFHCLIFLQNLAISFLFFLAFVGVGGCQNTSLFFKGWPTWIVGSLKQLNEILKYILHLKKGIEWIIKINVFAG